MLNIINDLELRKAIKTARNRTEAYHQMQGKIRKVYQGTFKGKKIIDNQASSHAIRLLANCIILYNSTLLNTIYQKMITEKVPQSVINEFIRISPIAWFYITFTGRYNFKKNTGKIDLQEILNTLEAKVRTTLWKKEKYKLVKQLSLLQSSDRDIKVSKPMSIKLELILIIVNLNNSNELRKFFLF